MAKGVYSDLDIKGYIDLNKKEIRNARVHVLGSAPSSPVTGQLYYDSGTNLLQWWDGTVWQSAKGGAPTGAAGGDLTGTYPNPTVVAAAITLAKMANLAANSFIGNNTGSAATPIALTVAQAKALLAIVPGDVTGFDTQVRTNRLDQMAAPTASVPFNSQKITGLLDPTAAQDAATKAYVDATAAGIDWKRSVRVATTAAGTLASSFENADVIDGVTLATGDRILIKDQAAGAENGIYTVNASGAPTRATDADTAAEVTSGMSVFVEEGTVNADTGWVMTNNGAITLGTTALVFAQFTALGQVTAGAALTKTGSTLDVAVDTTTIEVNADALRIAAGAAGAGLTGGAGSALAVGAGNGISVAADSVAVDPAVVVRKFAVGITGGATSEVITHNLNTRDVTVALVNNATPWDSVEVEWEATSVNTVTLRSPINLPASYRCVVHG